MWRWQSSEVADGVMRYEVSAADPLTVGEVLDLLASNAGFRLFLTEVLKESSFSAFRWETPAVTTATLQQPFEFVLVRADGLQRKSNVSAFQEHFDDSFPVAVFTNLGGDAVMVVPCPLADGCDYAHLAGFLRSAPATQIDCLWQAVGEAMLARIGQQPVWLSTAGMGVSWLHVRLDSRPKYYAYRPYRREPSQTE